MPFRDSYSGGKRYSWHRTMAEFDKETWIDDNRYQWQSVRSLLSIRRNTIQLSGIEPENQTKEHSNIQDRHLQTFFVCNFDKGRAGFRLGAARPSLQRWQVLQLRFRLRQTRPDAAFHQQNTQPCCQIRHWGRHYPIPWFVTTWRESIGLLG